MSTSHAGDTISHKNFENFAKAMGITVEEYLRIQEELDEEFGVDRGYGPAPAIGPEFRHLLDEPINGGKKYGKLIVSRGSSLEYMAQRLPGDSSPSNFHIYDSLIFKFENPRIITLRDLFKLLKYADFDYDIYIYYSGNLEFDGNEVILNMKNGHGKTYDEERELPA
jgi:hypothetical protein